MTNTPEGFDWSRPQDDGSPVYDGQIEDTVFKEFSRASSVKHATRLAILASDIHGIYELPEQSSVLAVSNQAYISGVTHPIHGLIGIDPELLAKPEVAVFTGVHEAVHARLGNSTAEKGIDMVAPGFREYFHSALVPAWTRGDLDFIENQEYIRYRGYDGLVPDGWNGPHSIDLDSMEATLGNYFKLVARDMIENTPSGGYYHIDSRYRSWVDELDNNSVFMPEHFTESPQWLADQMITGFGVGEQLLDYSRNNIRTMDLLAWEEGLANRIASDLTGISLDFIQKVAPQDEYKLRLAHQLASAGLGEKWLADEIHSYSDLHALIAAHF